MSSDAAPRDAAAGRTSVYRLCHVCQRQERSTMLACASCKRLADDVWVACADAERYAPLADGLARLLGPADDADRAAEVRVRHQHRVAELDRSVASVVPGGTLLLRWPGSSMRLIRLDDWFRRFPWAPVHTASAFDALVRGIEPGLLDEEPRVGEPPWLLRLVRRAATG